MSYKINEPAVAAEEVDGEVIAINLATGVYFSMTGWSAWAWNELAAGVAPSALVGVLTDQQVPDASGVVEAFVESLRGDELLVPGPAASRPPAAPPSIPFTGLAVERYTDMEDLILLDPVHDVDTSGGWPRAVAPPE
jgi:hypothetical protein